MLNTTNINTKLANKFYLFSVGLYAAVASVLFFLYLLQFQFGLNLLASVFIGYFITVIWRSIYDQLIIYELKVKQLNLKNNCILAFISSCIFTVLYYFIRIPLGDWSIPITILISMKITGEIKNFILTNGLAKPPEFFKFYSQKLPIYMYGLYGFFLAVAFITYDIIKTDGTSFYFAFASAIFTGLVFEQLYGLIFVYKKQPTVLIIFLTTALAIISSIFCSGTVFVLMSTVGFSGKAATITGIIFLKLIQPLIFNLSLK